MKIFIIALGVLFFIPVSYALPVERTQEKLLIVYPHDGQENVAKEVELIIRSLDPIEPTSISWVYQKTDGELKPTVRLISGRVSGFTENGKNIASSNGQYRLSDDRKTLTFKPVMLETEMKYSIHVSGLKAKDASGAEYSLPEVSSGFSSVTFPPKILKVFPEQGTLVQSRDILSVEFTKRIDATASPLGQLVSLEQYLPTYSKGQVPHLDNLSLPVSLTLSSDGKTILVKPTYPLTPGGSFGMSIHTSFITGDEKDDYTAVFMAEGSLQVGNSIGYGTIDGVEIGDPIKVPDHPPGTCMLIGKEHSADNKPHISWSPQYGLVLCDMALFRATVIGTITDNWIIRGIVFKNGDFDPRTPKGSDFSAPLTQDETVTFETDAPFSTGEFKITQIEFWDFPSNGQSNIIKDPYQIGGTDGFPASEVTVNPQYYPPISDPAKRTGPRIKIHFSKQVNHNTPILTQLLETGFAVQEISDGGVPEVDPLLNKTDPASVCRLPRKYNILNGEGIVYRWEDNGKTLVWDIYNDDNVLGKNYRFDMRKLASGLILINNVVVTSIDGDILAPIGNTLQFTTEFPNLRMTFKDLCLSLDGDVTEQCEPGEIFMGMIGLRYDLSINANKSISSFTAPRRGEEQLDPESKYLYRGQDIRGVRPVMATGLACAGGWDGREWRYKRMTENDEVKFGLSAFDADCGDLFVLWGAESFVDRAINDISTSQVKFPLLLGEAITTAMEECTRTPYRRWSDALCDCGGAGSQKHPGGDDWLGEADTPYWTRVGWWGYSACPHQIIQSVGVGINGPIIIQYDMVLE